MGDCDEALGWEDFKRVLREKFYPIHVRKDKSNEFARFEMGNLIVDEYYQKFIEYVKYFLAMHLWRKRGYNVLSWVCPSKFRNISKVIDMKP